MSKAASLKRHFLAFLSFFIFGAAGSVVFWVLFASEGALHPAVGAVMFTLATLSFAIVGYADFKDLKAEIKKEKTAKPEEQEYRV